MRAAWLLPCISLLLAAEAPIPVQTRIQKVRLHPDEAWVTRSGTAVLDGAGSFRLALADLPPGLGLDDVRLAARGPQGTRLGEIGLREEVQAYRETAEWKRLDQELLKARAEQQALQLQEKNQQYSQELFNHMLEAQTQDLRRRLGTTDLKAQTLLELDQAVEARSLEQLQEAGALQERRTAVEARIAELTASQQKLQQAAGVRPTRVLADLDMPRAGSVELELSYRIPNVRWSPAYEARLSADRSRLELVLLASVKQSTGQDWSGVQLELATQPSSTRLEAPQAEGLPSLSYREDGERPKSAPAEAAAPSSAQAGAVFAIPGQADLPDGEERRFRVTSADLAPSFRYQALPRQSSEVFLVALASPPPGFPLVNGAPMSLLQGQERLGSLPLAPPPPGEPLRLSFGAVPSLRANHRLLRHEAQEVGEKAKLREWFFLERFEVSSALSTPVEVELLDREVGSATGSVTVQQEANPEGQEPRPGLRSWTLNIAAGGLGAVELGTRIRGPLVGHLVNLGDLHLESN